MTTRVRSVVLAGSALTVAGVLASGCGSLSSGSSAAGSSGSGASTSASSAPAATGSTTAPAATPTTSGPTSGSGAGASPSTSSAGTVAGAPACTTGELKTSIGDGGGGAAGSFYSLIEFTNTSSASCTLYGYPGVSLRNAQLALIGAPATRGVAPESAPSLVTLAPGATASATLKETDYTVYPTSECKPATAAYLLVYPPNQTQSVKLAFTGGTCSNPSVKMLAVSVVVKGTGTS
ncbi:MAG TPA: DUF4232 domain-containing protein [Trebonia sp.]|nr:DUF4232 domain-containing protein [Trebonia sp.]